MCASPSLRTHALRFLALLALGACTPSRAEPDPPVQIDLGGSQVLQLVRIAPGSFLRGSPPAETGRGADETQSKVALTRQFLLGKFPITRGQFARFVAETRYRTDAESGPSGGFGWDGTKLTQRKDFTWRNPGFPQTDDHPVTLVSYKDAGAFLQWLSRRAGRTFTLPSEAQWEYAARAGTTEPPPAGDNAWHLGNSGMTTHPVGEKPANAWGLGDIPGNVFEWCEDWYAPYPEGDATDPLQHNSNLSDKPRRVLRGGSWLREPKFCRPAARYRNDPLSRNADNGFRVMTFQLESAPAAPPPPPHPAAQTQAPAVQTTEFNVESDIRSTSPPATLPIAEQTMSYPPASSSGFGLGWLLALPVVGIILFILRAIIRAVSGNMGGSGISSTGGFNYMPGQPLRVRIADDGFWITGDGISAGTLISCRYEMNGGQQEVDVRYEPGPQGQFVFTGARPANVTVSANAGAPPFRTMGSNPTVRQNYQDNDPPFQGHPRAY